MFNKKIAKISLVLAVLLTILLPYTTPVFAVTLTKDSQTAKLKILFAHEGGEESSGTLPQELKEIYDISQYEYKVGAKSVYKIVTDDLDYSNTLYCLDAAKQFPGVVNGTNQSLDYKNVGDLADPTLESVMSLHLSTARATDSAKWTKNYRAVMWLLDNFYLKKIATDTKNSYLEKAFADNELNYSIDQVKAILTDDDIEVVQQFAIWYFTNNDTADFNKTTLPAVSLKMHDIENAQVVDYASFADVNREKYGDRQALANILYQYLITEAGKATGEEPTTVTYPAIEKVGAKASKSDNYYVAGPFKVKSGTAAASEYTLKVVDQNKNEIPRTEYKIVINGTETSKNVTEIFDTEYYIYIPKTNTTISSVGLSLKYNKYETYNTLWKCTTSENDDVYQPVVLITKEQTPFEDEQVVVLDKNEPDLALRKYIIKVNDTSIDRKPTVDVTKLKNGTSTTAEYKHAKNPVQIGAGDTIVFEIRVYNEGNVEATGIEIVDALPTGLELVENSEINSIYGWEPLSTDHANNTIYKSTYLKDRKLDAFDKATGTTLDSAYVQMEVKVKDNVVSSKVLTNIAEIVAPKEDRDSDAGNNDYTKNDYDQSNYNGSRENDGKDLSDKTHYYPGREDDDDFEKLEVKGKAFDLAAKKFITKVNGKTVTPNRAPEVDVKPLQRGQTDADYKTVKSPLVVKQGDVITYTIRVYNEGEVDGYAETVADYIPEGLGYLVQHKTNVNNAWAIPSDAKTVKLSTIKNGTLYLGAADFEGVSSLGDAEVLQGKAKITSSKLKSNDTDTKNLITAFDKEKGTTLAYKDIEVVCLVIADQVNNNNFRNIAEVTNNTNKDRQPVEDIDSTPNTVNPDNYPDGEKRPDGTKQDDNDYENLTTVPDEKFDLSLEKFITKVNDKTISGREPKLTKTTEGNIQFTKTTEPLAVENNDLITYTIRVYNEGTKAGYAAEVKDNIPAGLVFVADNSTNKQYGWKMVDKDGNVTTDAKQAVAIVTDYLSREKGTNNLLPGFNPSDDVSKVPYKDIQVVFKVDQGAVGSDRKAINIAEISKDTDENGNEVDDKDSRPNNNDPKEDDIDQEVVKVKVFDLSLKKELVKIIVTEDGTTREIAVNSSILQKVEIHRKRIKTTTVKFVYNITVTNEGEIAGYATEVKDYIPAGLQFNEAENSQWKKSGDNIITTNALANTLLQPGQSASVQVTLQWINGDNNFGLKRNVAEISKDKNDSNTPDKDSTPDNKVETEDDIDNAEIMLQISTGSAPTYIALTTTVLAILATGVALIKKFVLE